MYLRWRDMKDLYNSAKNFCSKNLNNSTIVDVETEDFYHFWWCHSCSATSKQFHRISRVQLPSWNEGCSFMALDPIIQRMHYLKLARVASHRRNPIQRVSNFDLGDTARANQSPPYTTKACSECTCQSNFPMKLDCQSNCTINQRAHSFVNFGSTFPAHISYFLNDVDWRCSGTFRCKRRDRVLRGGGACVEVS